MTASLKATADRAVAGPSEEIEGRKMPGPRASGTTQMCRVKKQQKSQYLLHQKTSNATRKKSQHQKSTWHHLSAILFGRAEEWEQTRRNRAFARYIVLYGYIAPESNIDM